MLKDLCWTSEGTLWFNKTSYFEACHLKHAGAYVLLSAYTMLFLRSLPICSSQPYHEWIRPLHAAHIQELNAKGTREQYLPAWSTGVIPLERLEGEWAVRSVRLGAIRNPCIITPLSSRELYPWVLRCERSWSRRLSLQDIRCEWCHCLQWWWWIPGRNVILQPDQRLAKAVQIGRR